MPQMPAAAPAMHLGARIAKLAVGRGRDGALQRRPETRPAGMAFEFGLARIERQRAAGAGEGAGAMLVVQRTGEGPFGRRFAQHLILERGQPFRSEEHTSELQSLMRISYAVFCLKKKPTTQHTTHYPS